MKTIIEHTYEISKRQLKGNDYRNYINAHEYDNNEEELGKINDIDLSKYLFDNVVDMGNYYLINIWTIREENPNGLGYDEDTLSLPNYKWNKERELHFVDNDLFVKVKTYDNNYVEEQITKNQTFKVYFENVEELVDHWDFKDADEIAEEIYVDIYGVDFDLDLTKKEEKYIKEHLENQVDKYLSKIL